MGLLDSAKVTIAFPPTSRMTIKESFSMLSQTEVILLIANNKRGQEKLKAVGSFLVLFFSVEVG